MSWGAAIACSVIFLELFLLVLPIAIMTAGTFLSLFYKELSKKNEYYFYYNRGISKINLYVFTIILNVFTGILLHLIFHYV